MPGVMHVEADPAVFRECKDPSMPTLLTDITRGTSRTVTSGWIKKGCMLN